MDFGVIARLRADGHAVGAIAELSPSVADDAVLATASDSLAVVLTEDRDFGDLVFRLAHRHCGVVYTRLNHLSRNARLEVVAEAFREHVSEFLGAFTVLSPGKIRIRKMVNPDAL